MTDRLEAFVDELAQDLHDHDCRARGQEPWALHLTPKRQVEYRARAAALMPRISTELGVAHHAGEHEVRVQWHQFGGGPYPLENPTAPAAYAWPAVVSS